jgi:hypothetical protein
VNHTALVDGSMPYGLRPHRSPILVAVGDLRRVPAGPATRRTVAAAADEIHRALAAPVAAARPAPAEPERDPP